MKDYHEFLEEVLIPEEALQKRISELGAEISRDYQGKELLLVCILRGGVMFLTDLIRHISVPHMIDFMSVSSYGVGARRSRGQSRITLDINTDIQNRHVLLIEDIVDSGYTVKAVLELLSARKPKSLKICALLNKSERREVEVTIDYCGFVIPDKFVFGYGLDADEYYRNLPFIGVMAADKYNPGE
ncbi:MAG: hypoxanthine phosphoribosyltransferase [Anaerolineales bacterium]|jgi:hypoxanthine phosphoribosyltransferase